MDSLSTSMSPYAQRYNRVAAGGMRRTNVSPTQASTPTYGAAPGGSVPVAMAPLVPSAAPPAPPAGAGPGIVPSQPYNPLSLDSNITKFQGAEAAGVQGYGDMVGQDFTRSVGTLLGNLNGIGGLRSGGVQSGINDFATQYGRQIGDYAKMTAADATHAGQEEFDAATERKYRADAEKRARKQSLISGIGTVLGGAGGLILGGGNPAAGALGAKMGGSL